MQTDAALKWNLIQILKPFGKGRWEVENVRADRGEDKSEQLVLIKWHVQNQAADQGQNYK